MLIIIPVPGIPELGAGGEGVSAPPLFVRSVPTRGADSVHHLILQMFSPTGITESKFYLEKMTPVTYESKSTKKIT